MRMLSIFLSVVKHGAINRVCVTFALISPAARLHCLGNGCEILLPVCVALPNR